MRVQVDVVPYEIPLVSPLRASSSSAEVRRGLIVRVRDRADGVVGIGESAPLDERELGQARALLERCAARGFAFEPERSQPHEAVAALAAAVEAELGQGAPPSAHCGLETACLDMVARRSGCSVAELLGALADAGLEVNALIAEEPVERVAELASSFAARGFRTLKLKVGRETGRVARIVRGLVAAAERRPSAGADVVGSGTGSCTVRLDANRAWDLAAASTVMSELGGLPVDYVEEPLREPTPHILARLRRTSLAGIALDESIATPADVERFADAGACDVVVVKLQRVGGPTAALRIADAARARGLRVVLTDSLETAVGRAATLHVAAACTSEAVGLAGAFFLPDDASGHACPRLCPEAPGLAVSGSA